MGSTGAFRAATCFCNTAGKGLVGEYRGNSELDLTHKSVGIFPFFPRFLSVGPWRNFALTRID